MFTCLAVLFPQCNKTNTVIYLTLFLFERINNSNVFSFCLRLSLCLIASILSPTTPALLTPPDSITIRFAHPSSSPPSTSPSPSLPIPLLPLPPFVFFTSFIAIASDQYIAFYAHFFPPCFNNCDNQTHLATKHSIESEHLIDSIFHHSNNLPQISQHDFLHF